MNEVTKTDYMIVTAKWHRTFKIYRIPATIYDETTDWHSMNGHDWSDDEGGEITSNLFNYVAIRFEGGPLDGKIHE